MDLDDFESQNTGPAARLNGKSPKAALRYLDAEWWVQTSRASRFMDLLGDYAGTEPFIIDGAFVDMMSSTGVRF
jgi:hypothetical protein